MDMVCKVKKNVVSLVVTLFIGKLTLVCSSFEKSLGIFLVGTLRAIIVLKVLTGTIITCLSKVTFVKYFLQFLPK